MMLNIYLTSILIWGIVLFGLIFLFGQKISDNGWLEGISPYSPGHATLSYFFMSAIPILRLLMAITIIVMAMYTKEELEAFNELVESLKSEDQKDEDD